MTTRIATVFAAGLLLALSAAACGEGVSGQGFALDITEVAVTEVGKTEFENVGLTVPEPTDGHRGHGRDDGRRRGRNRLLGRVHRHNGRRQGSHDGRLDGGGRVRREGRRRRGLQEGLRRRDLLGPMRRLPRQGRTKSVLRDGRRRSCTV